MPRREHKKEESAPSYEFNVIFSTGTPTIARSRSSRNYSITESGIITSINTSVGVENTFYFTMHKPSDNIGSTVYHDDNTIVTTPCVYSIGLNINGQPYLGSANNFFNKLGTFSTYEVTAAYYGSNTNKTTQSFPFTYPGNGDNILQSYYFKHYYVKAIYLLPTKLTFSSTVAGEYDLIFTIFSCTAGNKNNQIIQPAYINRVQVYQSLGGTNSGGVITSDNIFAQNTLHISVS